MGFVGEYVEKSKNTIFQRVVHWGTAVQWGLTGGHPMLREEPRIAGNVTNKKKDHAIGSEKTPQNKWV